MRRSGGRLSRTVPCISSLALVVLAALAILRTRSEGVHVIAEPTRASSSAMGTFSATAVSYATPVLGVVVDRNVRMVNLDAGGAAEQAGIRKGDIITKVNAVVVTTSGDCKRLIRQAAGGQPIVITLTRAGEELTIPVIPGGRQGGAGQPTPTAVPSDLDYL